MKKRSLLAVLMSVVMAGALFAGCGAAQEQAAAPAAESKSEEAPAEEEEAPAEEAESAVSEAAPEEEVVEASGDYTIGFSQATMASPFYVTMVEAFENYCKDTSVTPMAISARSTSRASRPVSMPASKPGSRSSPWTAWLLPAARLLSSATTKRWAV